MRQLILLIILWLCHCSTIFAQSADTTRVYTENDPLVYEDVWDLWPYSFLNENGEPDGFNIDLIHLLMEKLNIPYVIKLKPQAEAFRDLRDGRSDLMLGLAVGFHDEFGKYSKNAVTLFTQSLVRPKSMPLEIRRFHDLSNHEVIVNDSSLALHLMKEYGWGKNAHPVEDMREAIQQVSHEEKGMILWNTLSLKWLMRRYQLDNLELTEVNMQHGQYKFMSDDIHLLELLDQAYTQLYASDKIVPLQDKWFYPERQEKSPIAPWMWYVGGSILLLSLIIGIYAITYRLQARKLTELNQKRNRRLALIIKNSHIHMWTFDIEQQQFAWRNDNGQIAFTYSMQEFAQRYKPEDFERLRAAIDELAAMKSGKEKDISLELKAKDTEGGDMEERDYLVVLSVLNHDKDGRPTVIIGTKKDVTEERQQQRLVEERTLRYWSIFYNSMVGILLFDKDGLLTNINPTASDMLKCDPEELIEKHVSMDSLLHTGQLSPKEYDGYVGTVNRETHIEYNLMTVLDDGGELIGVFAICRDITPRVISEGERAKETALLKEVTQTLNEYNTNIDSVLHESDVRLATYSPLSHMLTIHRSAYEVQHQLTQTRCMTLIDNRSKKLAMRLLNDMDNGLDRDIKADICTTLRIKGGLQLNLQFCLMPIRNSQGVVTEYLGLCRDISQLTDINNQAIVQAAKVQEVENTKNSFVRNMVQEIRTPMDTVINYVGRLGEHAASEDEEQLQKGILENADYLLHLIDNILYLSRLEAHMVEISPKPCNFAEIFESLCRTGWQNYQNDQTRYEVEIPYEQLTVDIDAEAIGNAIKQLTSNAAQHTAKGVVRSRFDYIGRRLLITVDDTGEGIPPTVLANLNKPKGSYNAKGLGLAICRELVNQMGGNLEVYSEIGSGTTVYMSIPCLASVIKRKKLS